MSDDLSVAPPAIGSREARGPAAAKISRTLSIVSLVLSVALVVPYLSVSPGAAVPLFALAFAGAIAGLVFAGRALRASPAPGRAATWALLSAIVALVGDGVLVIVFVVSLAGFNVDRVELHGQGPNNITATLSNDRETKTVLWPSNGRSLFNTQGDWAEITITAPPGSATMTVSCQINWNDEVVVDKTSDSGVVTCRYDKD